MRLHRNLVFSVIDGLNLIFNEGAYADKGVEKLLKRDARWGSRDRKFVAETTYEVVRWKRLYAEIADIKENCKVVIGYPNKDEEKLILRQNISKSLDHD